MSADFSYTIFHVTLDVQASSCAAVFLFLESQELNTYTTF
jgi:hypothetical protein